MEKRKRELVEKALNHLDNPLCYLNTWMHNAIMDLKEYSAPRLLDAMRDKAGRNKTERFCAGMFLIDIGYPDGWEIVREILKSRDTEAITMVLGKLDGELWIKKEQFTDPTIFTLITKHLDKKDTKIQKLAVSATYNLKINGYREKLKGMLKTASPEVQLRICRELAEEGQDMEILERIAAQILQPGGMKDMRRDELNLYQIEYYLKNGNATARGRAREIIGQYVLIHAPRLLVQPVTDYHEFEIIAKYGDKKVVPFLREVVEKLINSTVIKGYCLHGIARIEGLACRNYLRKFLKDPLLIREAMEVLADLCAASKDEELINECIESAPHSKYYSDYNLVKCLVKIGGPKAARKVSEILHRLNGEQRLEIRRIQKGLTLESELRKIVKIGLLKKMPSKAIRKQVWDYWGPDSHVSLLTLIYNTLDLSGVLVHFDTESDEVPPPYENLLGLYAKHSSGLFSPEWVNQEWSKNEKELQITVTYAFNNRIYEFHPQDWGDYYDTESVNQSVNNALADAGYKERFIHMKNWGQEGSYLFGKPKTVQKVADYLGVQAD